MTLLCRSKPTTAFQFSDGDYSVEGFPGILSESDFKAKFEVLPELPAAGQWVTGIGQQRGCSQVFVDSDGNLQPYTFLDNNNPADFRESTLNEVLYTLERDGNLGVLNDGEFSIDELYEQRNLLFIILMGLYDSAWIDECHDDEDSFMGAIGFNNGGVALKMPRSLWNKAAAQISGTPKDISADPVAVLTAESNWISPYDFLT